MRASVAFSPASVTAMSPGTSFKSENTMKDRKSTRLNSSHVEISYAVFCLKKKRRRAAPGGSGPDRRWLLRLIPGASGRPWLGSALFLVIDTAPTEIDTLSLHDALPISVDLADFRDARVGGVLAGQRHRDVAGHEFQEREHHERSEEHTSELQSRRDLVCRLLLEKKKTTSCSGWQRP